MKHAKKYAEKVWKNGTREFASCKEYSRIDFEAGYNAAKEQTSKKLSEEDIETDFLEFKNEVMPFLEFEGDDNSELLIAQAAHDRGMRVGFRLAHGEEV